MTDHSTDTIETRGPRELIRKVRRFIKLWAGPDYPGKTWPPPGLRLEMHPAVRIMILRDDHVLLNLPFGKDPLSEVFGLPVQMNNDLDVTGWRLVIITEDIVLTGSMQ